MRSLTAAVLLLGFVAFPRPGAGFSVLAHQAVVDGAWDDSIAPELRRRFPGATPGDFEKARAFAYGGSHIADLGYFPLGNRLFTDLLHYVRSGDFIVALLESAKKPDEYAFALGAAAHYITDSTGHPEATNRAVAVIYPKLRQKHGDTVTYADDHGAHMTTEFRFDVLQMSRSTGSPDLYGHSLGFQVSERVLDEAFQKTYGLRLDDLFASTDTAIETYRFAFRTLIHEVTGIAWELYRADIEKLDVKATPATFVSDVTRTDFEREFGKTYREPGYFAKFVAFLVKLIPNIGPLRRTGYKPLPPDVQTLFTEALDHATARYRETVAHVHTRRPELPNLNLDTGLPTRRNEYQPTDEAYVSLLEKLEERDFAGVPRTMRDDFHRFFEEGGDGTGTTADSARVRLALARLDRIPDTPR